MPIGLDTHAWRRDLQHLEKVGKTQFVTFCSRKRRQLTDEEREITLATVVRDHRCSYWLHCAVVMPDHVHLVFTLYDQARLADILQRIKSVSAHAAGRRLWQREYFDRMLRCDEDLRRKCEYVCDNPVRAGLVVSAGDYRWIWRSWVEGELAPAGAPAPH